MLSTPAYCLPPSFNDVDIIHLYFKYVFGEILLITHIIFSVCFW
nr:MAG TPA: hypothetical protein [Caudoviricetes sp.]